MNTWWYVHVNQMFTESILLTFFCLNEFLIKENALSFKLRYRYKINNMIHSERLKVHLKGNLAERALTITHVTHSCHFKFVFWFKFFWQLIIKFLMQSYKVDDTCIYASLHFDFFFNYEKYFWTFYTEYLPIICDKRVNYA